MKYKYDETFEGVLFQKDKAINIQDKVLLQQLIDDLTELVFDLEKIKMEEWE